MRYRNAFRESGLSRPWTDAPSSWNSLKITLTDRADYPHWNPALTAPLLSGLCENYDVDAHWSPYASSASRRLLKRPCAHQGCEFHAEDETDLGEDVQWNAVVVEVDILDHSNAQYDDERSHLLLMVVLDQMAGKGIPLPSMVYFSKSGGLRLIYVLSEPLIYIEDYEGHVRGLTNALMALNPVLRDQMKLGFVDDIKDGFRLWRCPWVVAGEKNLHDRAFYLLNTKSHVPSDLPFEEEPESEAPTTLSTDLDYIIRKIKLENSQSRGSERFARYRVKRTVEKIEKLTDGRKLALFNGGIHLGTFVGAGLLNFDDAMDALVRAAHNAYGGRAPTQALAQIPSGLRIGRTKPWTPKKGGK